MIYNTVRICFIQRILFFVQVSNLQTSNSPVNRVSIGVTPIERQMLIRVAEIHRSVFFIKLLH